MTLRTFLFLGGALLLCPAAAQAQATDSCVAVTVNGVRAAPSFECLSQRLAPTGGPRPAGAGGPGALLGAEAIAQRPGHQLGQFNHATTSHRMGNQFGRSALPQRPPVPPAP